MSSRCTRSSQTSRAGTSPRTWPSSIGPRGTTGRLARAGRCSTLGASTWHALMPVTRPRRAPLAGASCIPLPSVGPAPTTCSCVEPRSWARPAVDARAGRSPVPHPGGLPARPHRGGGQVPYAPRRPCPAAGCPETISPRERACAEHASRYERARGTRQARGYGAEHDAERTRWAPIVASGTAHCVRCGGVIVPGSRWSPDHDDDRTRYLGPAHERCNLRAGGRAVKHRGNDR